LIRVALPRDGENMTEQRAPSLRRLVAAAAAGIIPVSLAIWLTYPGGPPNAAAPRSGIVPSIKTAANPSRAVDAYQTQQVSQARVATRP
jgi:hypothetical protein